MNKRDRAELDSARSLLERAKTIVEELASNEQEKFENMPENLQESERARAFEEAAEQLTEVVGTIEQAACDLENIEG